MPDTAYFVSPPSGPGPGVLLLHSWWGLTPFFRRLADRLSERGYTVLVPDLADGETFVDAEEAREHLASLDADRLAGLTLTSASLVRDKSVDPEAPIAIVGFSMGASLGLWASVRMPESVGRVVAFYGVQSIDFAGSEASYQLHLAAADDLVSDDEAVFMEATMGMEDLEVEVHRYPGTSHFFFERDREEYDEAAATLAWERMLRFLGGPT
ncbi:MAG TPA: dienelactone hydrolase family protein [Acidimicrobiia bacterium]|nr:dienelactone hydrolase family protein [Acidimicrobiia bacterium]